MACKRAGEKSFAISILRLVITKCRTSRRAADENTGHSILRGLPGLAYNAR